MSKTLLIVESPSKAKTLKKYLGTGFEVLASYGHVRDLIPKSGAVDPDHNFAMKYQVVSKNSKYVDAIADATRKSDQIYLATDPDREGEAISWHLVELLKEKKLLNNKLVKRVAFHELTKSAVLDAMAHPRDISDDLVQAQQARRALDYLVGFNLSPLLWKKIRRGLSAGRVQSPALRLVCEREADIRQFTSQEYWSIHLDSHQEKQKFSAKLMAYQEKKLEALSIENEAMQAALIAGMSGFPALVERVERKKKQRHPVAPFTTSTMLQEAVRKLSLTAGRTTRAAQQLYEGINIGQETVGLITYMRTDSVALSQEALREIRVYIGHHFGDDYVPTSPRMFKNKTKNAQEAHEAIRPTSIQRTPEEMKPYLSSDQFKLYQMIWRRALASQMASAEMDTTGVDIAVGPGRFRARGQVILFPGFLSVYEEEGDDVQGVQDDESRLPVLNEGQELPIDRIFGEQHFTQPPPRYTEASLIKTLEEFGIGRPSTYPSIITTLKDRDYVGLDKKRFMPTDTGEVVNKFLTTHFSKYVDYDFTAKLEDQLDHISNGDIQWIPVLQDFWTGFSEQVRGKEHIPREEITTEETDEKCPECGCSLLIRLGRKGKFYACSAYNKNDPSSCRYTRDYVSPGSEGTGEEQHHEVTVIEDRLCPKDDAPLVIRKGKYGQFIGCSNYPNCRYIESLNKPQETGVTCPECKVGELIGRKNRFGSVFYSCNQYPKCKYAIPNPPLAEPCPQCAWPILTLKTTKRWGTEKVCPQKECDYKISVDVQDLYA